MKKFLLATGLVTVVAAGVIGVMVATFDVNAYRGEIAQALERFSGHPFKLQGPIGIGVSSSGVTVDVRDVTVGNALWSSAPEMAKIGRFELGVALLPLLRREIVITRVAVEHASILLESTRDGRHNWQSDIRTAHGADVDQKGAKEAVAAPSASSSVSVRVDQVSVTDSKLTLRAADGALTLLNVSQLTFGGHGRYVTIHFMGDYNGTAIDATAKTDAVAFTAQTAAPLSLDATYAGYRLKARGQISLGEKMANLTFYDLTAGSTTVHGQLSAGWGGKRPVLRGSVSGDRVMLADFAAAAAKGSAGEDAKGGSAAASGGPVNGRVFNDAPLPLDALKAADANIEINIDHVPTGSVEVAQLKGTVVLQNGRLSVAPFDFYLGNGPVNGQLTLDASGSQARIVATVKAKDVDISDMLKLWGAEAFLSGKVAAEANLTTSGGTPHALASNLSGSLNIIGAGGDVISRTASRVSSGLTALLTGGGSGADNVNCLVARFTAKDGIVKDNGILIDTGAATIAGNGGLDFRDETIDLTFRGQSKNIKVGNLLPPVHVGGTLAKPGISVSPAAVMQNVAGLLTGKRLVESNVPAITTQQGQNACLYTLNHATEASNSAPSEGGVVQDLAGKANQKINELGGGVGQQIMKGLFGQ